jgi:hypothetical protein
MRPSERELEVRALYTDILWREADAGLHGFVTGSMTLDEIKDAISSSPEAKLLENNQELLSQRHQSMSLTLRGSLLKKYWNPTFVETGTYTGGGIATALAMGFQKVLSIDINENYVRNARIRFTGRSIDVRFGDSSHAFKHMVSSLKTTATIWLDSHVAHEAVPKGTTLLDELEALATLPYREHTILIDDRRMLGSAAWQGVTEVEVLAALKKINPSYKIKFEDGGAVGHHEPGDIICTVAR